MDMPVQGKFHEAESLYKRSLSIDEKVYGPDHPEVAADLNNMAVLMESQARRWGSSDKFLGSTSGKCVEAVPLHRQSLGIREKTLGPEHPDVAESLNNLAGVLRSQASVNPVFEILRNFQDAEPLYERSLAIDEKVYGPDHPEVATDLNNWAALYEVQAIREKTIGAEHLDLVDVIIRRARVCDNQAKHEEARRLYGRSLEISEKNLGASHPAIAGVLNDMAESLLRQVENVMLSRSFSCVLRLALRSAALSVMGQGIDVRMSSLDHILFARFVVSQGKGSEAEPLCARAMAIWTKGKGPHDRTVVTSLNRRAELSEKQVWVEEHYRILERVKSVLWTGYRFSFF
ncbi:unnamed protein product [Ectocarpus sp. CCAP 1310/34]|nr:unnamed protein product [Ectocarpus sp. CCAP 1310/34]